jgi:alpha-D-xyloside xylohydrolase
MKKICFGLLSLTLLAATSIASAQRPNPQPDVFVSAQQLPDGEFLKLTNGTMRVKPCSAGIIRITYADGATIPDLSNPALSDAACANASFSASESKDALEVMTAEVRMSINKNSGAISFKNADGKAILTESGWPFPRSLVPNDSGGQHAKEASTWFALDPDERLYGLGQHQNGVLNQRNLEMELSQDNTNISVPFFLSSKGYGILWNNGSVTSWNNRFRPVLAIQSEYANAVDYYYVAGPSFDKIIAGYRSLSGGAPLFPRWAYGYWQSKLGYRSSDELLAVAGEYRELHIPLDTIVLDAGWEDSFGSRVFNENYPDPKAMVQKLHDEHVNLMVSIWPLFQPGNANYDDFKAKDYFVTPGPNHLPDYLPGARLYDAFSEDARKAYWEQAKKSLYDIGVDAFWMDSTEPADLYAEEHGPMLAGATTALGNGSKYANLFPLMTTAAIYDGQRSLPDSKRVFILTRSAFTGMQRNAAAAWSGDSLTTFDTFRRQIPAGLNYSLSGLPYWTTDIGGFVGGDTTDPAYRELFMRWFEYGTFCPIFRAHGSRKNNQNELWSYGPQAQAILTRYDRLRYRLMPYIYTLAAKTTFENYTPMRALAFDFSNDEKALDISDEFMFGPSLLVAPVTEEGAVAREVYLPKGSDWYDFWTGKRITGGRSIHRPAPLGTLPLYVRAGTILPLGPEEEYPGEHPSAPIELRIYPGADGDAKIYADNGMNYDYEKGAYTWLPLHWREAAHTLTVDSRQGHFADAPVSQQFTVTWGTAGHATGEAIPAAGRPLRYTNLRTSMRLLP